MTDPSLDQAGPELPVFARAILVGHQRDAISYLDMRIAQMVEDEQDDDAEYWSAVKVEAQRQIDAGEWVAGV